jgi:hypothetical protein
MPPFGQRVRDEKRPSTQGAKVAVHRRLQIETVETRLAIQAEPHHYGRVEHPG